MLLLDCVEYAADVESARNEEAAVIPGWKLTGWDLCLRSHARRFRLKR